MRLIVALLAAVLSGCSPEGQKSGLGVEQAQPPATVVAPTGRTTPAPVEAPAQLERPVVSVVMDVMQVVGRTEAEIAALLGQPASCADIHRARLCKYGPHQDEVLFVRHKADMITVQGMDAVAYDAGALHALGLAPATPDHANEHAIRWESIPGLVEVAVFPGAGSSVGYAYVKVGKH